MANIACGAHGDNKGRQRDIKTMSCSSAVGCLRFPPDPSPLKPPIQRNTTKEVKSEGERRQHARLSETTVAARPADAIVIRARARAPAVAARLGQIRGAALAHREGDALPWRRAPDLLPDVVAEGGLQDVHEVVALLSSLSMLAALRSRIAGRPTTSTDLEDTWAISGGNIWGETLGSAEADGLAICAQRAAAVVGVT